MEKIAKRKPRLLDLFCGAGGAGMGYHRAGFEVVGVDINSQKHYPFEFHKMDAMKYLGLNSRHFDVIHASPPCQAYSLTKRCTGNEAHQDLIERLRWLLTEKRKRFVIENVVGSPLRDPILLCGSMFGLKTYRHRLFESTVFLEPPEHLKHTASVRKMGRAVLNGEYMHVVGHFSGVQKAREAMGIDWMTRDELAQAIQPAYTEYIGKQLMQGL